MALQVAANLNMLFRERGSLISRVTAAKMAGFGLVEVSNPYSETPQAMAAEIKKCEVKAVLINTDPGNSAAGEMGCACIPGKEDLFRASLDKSVTYAKEMNVPMIHIMVGNRDENHTEEEHRATLEKNLLHAANLFQREGIVGLVEPKNNITFPKYYLNDYDKAVSFLNKVNSSSLRLLLDIFHLQLICGNVSGNIERLMPYTGHVQVSQPPLRSEPGSAGELDFEYVISKLKSAGYKGCIGAEYIPSTKATEDSFEWIKKCGLSS